MPQTMHQEVITSMDTNFAETHLLTTSETIKIYSIDKDSLTLESELQSPDEKSQITQAIFMGFGELIAASTLNGRILLYKLENETYKKNYDKKIMEGSISALAYQVKENNVFSLIMGCSDGNIRTCLLTNEGLGEAAIVDFASHKYGITSICANKSFILSGGEDKTVRLINENEIIFECKYEAEVRDVAIVREDIFNSICFAVCLDNEVKIYNKRNEEADFSEQVLKNLTGCSAIKWTRAGYCLVVGLENEHKSFMPDDDGKFIEVEMEKLGN